jgi:transposase InsO family protein
MGQWNLFGERFKCEKYYLHKYQTFEELALAMDEYIRFYHYERYPKRLNGLSPMEYRAKAA